MSQISPRNTQLYTITQFLYALIFHIPIWVIFYQQRISVPQISFMIGFQYFIQMVLELPTGALADMIGRKKTVILGYGFFAVAVFAIMFAKDLSLILFYTIFAGISDALLSGSLEALLYDSYKQDHREDELTTTLSKSSFWYQISLVIATISGGFLYQFWPKLPFILHGTCLVIATILSCFFIEPTVDSEHFTIRNYLKQIREGTKEAFHSARGAWFSTYYILVAGISWSCTLFFNNYMFVALGFNDWQRGVLEGSLRLFNILVLTKIITSSSFFTKRNTILFFPIILVISLTPGIFLSGYWAMPFIAGAMITTTVRFIILSKYMNDEFSSKYRATAISALSMLTGIVYITITIISGPIMQWGGGVKSMYTLLGIAALIFIAPLAVKLIQLQTQEDALDAATHLH